MTLKVGALSPGALWYLEAPHHTLSRIGEERFEEA
jgi:hypothetical protein